MNLRHDSTFRQTTVAIFAVALVVLLAALLVWTVGPASFGGRSDDAARFDRADEHLVMVVFDVGQAQAVGVIAPTGEAMLIDTSRSGERVAETIVPYFEARGAIDLDYLVLSHPDQDHIGGTPQLLELMTVHTLLDPAIPSTNQTYAETLELAIELELDAEIARRGDVYTLAEGVNVEIHWPDEPLIKSSGEPDSNENSVVVRIEYGDTAFLVPGDIGFAAEEILVNTDTGELEADVLIVGHHGSAGSTSGDFLDAVDPEIAIVSAGLDNQYGHPSDEVIRRLRIRGIDMYRTDLDGTIEVISDGQNVVVQLPDLEGGP